jgi:hypothetical protein
MWLPNEKNSIFSLYACNRIVRIECQVTTATSNQKTMNLISSNSIGASTLAAGGLADSDASKNY